MKNTLILLIVFLSNSLFSQNKSLQENFIDIEESKCFGKQDISNAAMRECTIIARESWDKELNKYYKLLLTKLPKDAFEILKASQKEWIIYRDKEFKFITKFYFEVKEGTMWYNIAENKKKEIVKNRALELQMYFENLEY
ncbi:lysozyme inhibitor LprI family protein [Chryseobacterium indoltheticum]|uniref:lysozyme inhibitor LprI family protein n=1 Tax=Chryseobacterium indoltheticum TaxID=254 RepID=UPI0028ED6910|nr:lysozyme inhibitor LprI family protein [Chryseobacterium indoltheticum]